MIDFSLDKCQTFSKRKLFGLCDDPPPATNPAYIDENSGEKWIAVVNNENGYNIQCTAVDHCIDIRRENGTMEKRCDCFLSYNDVVVFVELKQRGAIGNAWVKDAEQQLRVTISKFETTALAENYNQKKAYIANSEHPKFKESQQRRMDQFLDDTGYVLRVENRITLI